MQKRLPFRFLISFITILLIAVTGNAFSQNMPNGEGLEQIIGRFKGKLEQVKKQSGASDDEFATFSRFNERSLDADEGKLYADFQKGKVNLTYLANFEKEIFEKYTNIFRQFQNIEKEYPSSVKEFGREAPHVLQTFTCDSACTNADFSSGDLNGWYAAYGVNSSLGNNYFNITGITGAQCATGQLRAAQDPNTNNTYQVSIMHGGNDPIIPSIPCVSPFGGSGFSARIGDSTGINYGVAILQQTFKVTTASENFTYQYAVFLENPPNHTYYTQPFFNAVVLDSVGDTIPACGKYLVTSGYQTTGAGWDSTTITQSGIPTKLFYRNWTTVFTPLKKYVGHCVTVCFTVSDCGQGGHFGYAYVSTSCNPVGVISSSPNLCGNQVISLTGPPGAAAYKWSGPTNGVVGSDSTQVIHADSAGTYRLILTPVTGATCNDTLYTTINKAAGIIPHPNFITDTVCAGTGTQFTNLSTPGSGPGVKFYWDFYNQGVYNDSSSNPNWAYVTGGIFTVKLHEINGSCGNDTLLPVRVDSLPALSFTNTNVCAGGTVNFTNTSTGSVRYSWNFGDPSSGTADTSTAINPSHTFDTAGTYVVELIGQGVGPCAPDTIRTGIIINSQPAPIITGPDSVCQGSSIHLTISNNSFFNTYTWSPNQFLNCYTCINVTATPTTNITYTITSNGFLCSSDTTFTIKVNPLPPGSITYTPTDTICKSDSTLLKGNGGCTYIWSPGNSTADSIWVKPTSTTTYSLQAICLGCVAHVTQNIQVVSGIDAISLLHDSICPLATTTMVASGGTNYQWLPPLSSTNPSVNVSPSVTTTYSCVISSKCAPTDTLSEVVHVVPPPHISYTGNTTICLGDTTVLTASGGTNYTWISNSSSTPGSVANLYPSATTNYTLTVGDGNCLADSVIKLTVNPKPVVTISPSDTICYGDSTLLSATGGGSYRWSNSNTGSSIEVMPVTTTKYTVVVTTNGCTDSASTMVHIKGAALTACCSDTINQGSTVNLSVSGANSYAWTPSSSLSCYTCINPAASPLVTTTYTIIGTEANGCRVEQTLTVYVENPCSDFQVPNTFTPNNDGINDYLVINVLNPSSYSISILDRWGKPVFASSNVTDYWNGKINGTGSVVPDGVYYYVIKAKCNSYEYDKKGFVEVVGEK
jgi:gliding motility-associated-like protein